MNTSIAEETATAPTTAAGKEPKAKKKPRVAPRRAHVAPAKPKVAKKASRAKKAPKSAQKATGPRDGSKTAKLLDLLRRKDGATLQELMKASGWQAHSVRGFLSGAVGKKMGLAVTSVKDDNGERSYSVKA